MRRMRQLAPRARETLLDSLRPPSGFRLDQAVGTCFSVDPMAALLVPLAFAIFDAEDSDDDSDPVAKLAATKTFARRITLYCEQGRISAATKAPTVFSYLEESLLPVRSPRGGSFHPKIWVLRFASGGKGDFVHRTLCLSRNLTFDRSWDSIVRLEQDERSEGSDQSIPLIEFLLELDKQAPSEGTRSIATSLSGVAFAPPAGFESLVFRPMVPGGGADCVGPKSEGRSRIFIASPFLADDRLRTLANRFDRVEVASRPEALDALNRDLVSSLSGIYVFDSLESDSPQSADSFVAIDEDSAEASGLHGLHAKIYCWEDGEKGHLLSGSANATVAAFQRNFEFGVELIGRKTTVGPAALLSAGKGEVGLKALLREYEPSLPLEPDSQEEADFSKLEGIRRVMVDADWTATLTLSPEGGAELSLVGEPEPAASWPDCTVKIWPITLDEDEACFIDKRSGSVAAWQLPSAASATALFGFEMRLATNDKARVRFAIKAGLKGDLEGRLDLIMREVLSDSGDVLRYLLLLLAGENPGSSVHSSVSGSAAIGAGGSATVGSIASIPLLETMVRTFSRDPSSLKSFKSAMEQMEGDDELAGELPEGLLDIWRPFDHALDGATAARGGSS